MESYGDAAVDIHAARRSNTAIDVCTFCARARTAVLRARTIGMYGKRDALLKAAHAALLTQIQHAKLRRPLAAYTVRSILHGMDARSQRAFEHTDEIREIFGQDDRLRKDFRQMLCPF